ncbi:MAG: DUF4426 domain-containing protein [Gammaproteobacteria bacterium]|nr:DUF4426 domain-containing protein [Gammaproteobacteria bacterium]
MVSIKFVAQGTLLLSIGVGLLVGCGGAPDTNGATQPVTASPSQSARSHTFGNYEVHFHAMTTEHVPASVAQQYGITRSHSRAMLNVVVTKLQDGQESIPVAADIKVKTNNLTGQVKDLRLREVSEDKAIYYLGDTSVDDGETLVFDISVQPVDSKGDGFEIRFQQQFFRH